jgi:hypothetical protein
VSKVFYIFSVSVVLLLKTVQNSCQKLRLISSSKVDGSEAFFPTTEKSNVMAWFDDGITPKEIVGRLGRNADSVQKIIRITKHLPLLVTPAPKRRSG